MVWYWALLGALVLGSVAAHVSGLLRFDRGLPKAGVARRRREARRIPHKR